MEIGQKLKTKRTAAGLSQEALAEKIGVSRQTISSWENNDCFWLPHWSGPSAAAI